MLTRTRAALVVVAAAGLAGIASACSSPSAPSPEPTGTTSSADPTATATATAPPSPQTWNGLTGEEIVTQARTALRGASSYRVAGMLPAGRTRVNLDMVYTGDDRQGTWRSGEGSAEVIRIDGTMYALGNAAFWENIVYEETAATLVGAWVELDGPYAAFGESLVPDIATLLTPAGVLQPDEEKIVDGRQAIALTDGTITVAVAIEDPKYPLRVTMADGTNLALNDFDAPVAIEAPTGQVYSLAAVTGNG